MLKGVKVGYFSSINQLFLLNSEKKREKKRGQVVCFTILFINPSTWALSRLSSRDELTAICNSWGHSQINLLHRGADIKIVCFSNSTKRPLWPSFYFNTAGSRTAAIMVNEIVKTSFVERPL
jgi:hypothetical protein